MATTGFEIAMWNYVNETNENSTEVCVSSKHLNDTVEVIVEGNFELAHLTPIVVK